MSTIEAYEITKEDIIEILAHALFELVAEQDRLEALLKQKRADFAQLVGPDYRGDFAPFGEILTTAETQDRPGEGMQLAFDATLYPSLPVDLRTRLEKAGFAKLEQKMIKGQPSKVVVKRAKAKK